MKKYPRLVDYITDADLQHYLEKFKQFSQEGHSTNLSKSKAGITVRVHWLLMERCEEYQKIVANNRKRNTSFYTEEIKRGKRKAADLVESQFDLDFEKVNKKLLKIIQQQGDVLKTIKKKYSPGQPTFNLIDNLERKSRKQLLEVTK